jgi:glycosyltransferase involved in cell wall biosynthesis
MRPGEKLRIGLLAGVLGQGGAEGQLVYKVRALREAGVEVRVYSLTQGDYHEATLKQRGIPVIWVGRSRNRALRSLSLAWEARRFRPHILHCHHLFANIYAAVAARMLGCISLGSIQSSVQYYRPLLGKWLPYLLRAPMGLLVNSLSAEEELRQSGLIDPKRMWLLRNVIEVAEFERPSDAGPTTVNVAASTPTAVFVGRLDWPKRVDQFLKALARARREEPQLRGTIVGDGPERARMEAYACELGLPPDEVRFLGTRGDVAQILWQSSMQVLSSDFEGCANVILEGMAAGLPVITTPAGDAAKTVQDGSTGFVVPFDDTERMAERIVHLARSPELRRKLGRAGRRRVEELYSYDRLAGRLFSIYREVASQQGKHLPLPVTAQEAD